jgi:hypothetical protein
LSFAEDFGKNNKTIDLKEKDCRVMRIIVAGIYELVVISFYIELSIIKKMSIFCFCIPSCPDLFCSIIKNLPGPLLTGIIVILVFVLGRSHEKRQEQKKKINRIQAIEGLISYQIQALQDPLRNQVFAIINFLRLLKQNKEQELQLSRISSYRPSELLFIEKDELFLAFVQKRDGDPSHKNMEFSKFRNNILYLIDSKDAITSWVTEFAQKYQLYVSNYKNHLENVVRVLDEFGIEAEAKRTKIGEDKFMEATDKIMNDLQKIENFQDINISHAHLIIPLHELCQNKTIVYGDKRVNRILNDIMSAMFNFDNYKYIHDTYYRLFFDMAKKMNESNRNLKSSYLSLIHNKILK